MRRIGWWWIVGLMTSVGSGAALAEDWTIDRDASVFAVVTQKAGLAAKLAHDHLVVAQDYDAALRFDPAAPASAELRLDVPTAALVIDDPDSQARWQDRLVELGLLAEPFGEISAKDRKKIRESMLSKKQLDADRHPRLSAELVSVTPRDDDAFPFEIELRVEIVGRSVTRPMVGRFEVVDGRLHVEAHGELRFTDFGIEPYSAMLGAVRNDDPFYVYVHLEAVASETPPGDDTSE